MAIILPKSSFIPKESSYSLFTHLWKPSHESFGFCLIMDLNSSCLNPGDRS